MASWIAIFTIEKFGRRSLMMFGAAGMSASMAILAGATSDYSNKSLGLLAVSHLILFYILHETDSLRPSSFSYSTHSLQLVG